MGNPWSGEVTISLNGECHRAKLTLGALAELEDSLESGSLLDLVERFEQRRFSTRDVLALLLVGLRAGGWTGSANDLKAADFEGGPLYAARVAAELLARAFTLPGEP